MPSSTWDTRRERSFNLLRVYPLILDFIFINDARRFLVAWDVILLLDLESVRRLYSSRTASGAVGAPQSPGKKWRRRFPADW